MISLLGRIVGEGAVEPVGAPDEDGATEPVGAGVPASGQVAVGGPLRAL